MFAGLGSEARRGEASSSDTLALQRVYQRVGCGERADRLADDRDGDMGDCDGCSYLATGKISFLVDRCLVLGILDRFFCCVVVSWVPWIRLFSSSFPLLLLLLYFFLLFSCVLLCCATLGLRGLISFVFLLYSRYFVDINRFYWVLNYHFNAPYLPI